MQTLNIDPLVTWITERSAINTRRAAGEPLPWSKDELFARYRFCNVNVQEDRVSRAIYETFTRPFADHAGLIVALTVCRFTNAPEVFEAVRDCLVPFDAQRFVAIMADRAASGLLLERRAYMIPGGRKGELKAACLTNELFVPLANAVEQIRPKPGDTCAAVFERLRVFPHLGKGFLTAQIVRDLKQVEPLRSAPDWKTFVWPGPGSQRGINRLLGATTEADIERERPVPEWRDLFWEVFNQAAPRIAEQGVEIDDAQSSQNALCETDKAIRWRGMSHEERIRHGARLFVPYGKAPTPRPRKIAPVPAPIPAAIEAPAPASLHAIPELAAARDPNAPHVLHHDAETRSVVDLTAVGAHVYAAHPSTEVQCVAYAADDEPVQLWTPGDPVPMEFIEAANSPGWTLVAHNDAFERLIARHILEPRHGFPAVPIERRRCSMAMALAAALPAALKNANPALGLPFVKDAAGQALMRRMAKPLAPGIWIEDSASREQLYAYCRRDVEAERALYRVLPPLTAEEQKLWELDAVINARGFHTDGALLDAAHQVVTKAGTALQAEFREITGLDSTNQTAKLIAWLAARDCIVKDVQKGTLKHALRRKGLAPEAKRAIELRLELAHASAAKVEALRAWRGADGRVRGTLRFHGAGPGRWTGFGPQPQNFKRDGEDITGKIAAILAGGAGLESPVEAVGDITRAMTCAAPGHRLMVADFSGIESRVLAWISGQQSKVDAWQRFDETGDPADDPYVQIAARCGLTGEGARDIGKVIDLAFGFGGGIGAWKRTAPEDDETDDDTAKRYKDTWRAAHQSTARFWYGLERAAIMAVRVSNPEMAFPVGRVSYRFADPFLRLTLPSGRAISYPFAKIRGPNQYGKLELTFLDNAGGKFTECRFGQGAWFGMLVENVVQAIARDLLAGALMRLEAAGYPVVLHVHDEIVAEVPESFGDLDEFKRIIVEVPAWAEGLPVAAKARNGQRFAKIGDDAERGFSQPSPRYDTASESEQRENAQNSPTILTNSTEPACAAPAAQDPAPEVHDDQGDGGDGGNGGYGNDGDDEDSLQALLAAAADTAAPGYGAGEQRDCGTFTTEYIYKLADGQPHLKVMRRENPKGFPQSWCVNGAWVTRKPAGWVNVPYHLPELVAGPADVPVWVCEGEKDCESLARLGLVATTAPEGAGKWRTDYNRWFVGRKIVYICEDNDAAGRGHALDVAGGMLSVGVPHVAIVKFAELAEQGDVSDWLAAGHTREQLIERAKVAPKFERPPLPFINMHGWDYVPVPEQQWTLPFKIPVQECVIFSGQGGAGKSMEGLHLCAAHSIEREIWGAIPKRGPAIFIDAEDTETVIHRRLDAVREHYGVKFEDFIRGGLHLISLVGHDPVLATVNKNGKIEPTSLYQQLLQAAGDVKPVQMVIASSANVFAGNENDRAQVQQFVGLLARLAMVAQGSTMLIAHPSLTGISSGSGLSGSTAWHNAVRARFVMRGIKVEEGEQPDNDLREIEFKKNQHGTLAETIVVQFRNGMFLPVPGATSIDEARVDEIFVELLQRFTKSGRFVSDNPSAKNYAPAQFAKEGEAKREGASIGKVAFEGAMRRLFAAGAIRNENYGRPSNPHRRVVLTGG
jgi:DNA polymerase